MTGYKVPNRINAAFQKCRTIPKAVNPESTGEFILRNRGGEEELISRRPVRTPLQERYL